MTHRALTPSLLVAIATLLLAEAATAQVKPRIYILFDTSGSMLYNSANAVQPGDGSPLCDSLDPTGLGKTTRIYQLKQAFFEVLQGIGSTEVEWALATFPMLVDPSRTPKCPRYPSC